MAFSRKWLPLICLSLAVASMVLLFQAVSAYPQSTVKGVVLDESQAPVGGATVRVQATTNKTTTSSDGTFTLDGLTDGLTVTVSAWKQGYYCAKVVGVVPPASQITLNLRRYQTDDNPAYIWVPVTGTNSCYSCKPTVTQIWLDNDAHRSSVTNARFFSLYNGSDISNTQVISPGYKLDFPSTAGNCAACHAPAAALDAPFTTDMNLVSGIDRDFGIHCDFCHKVASVYLNPATGLPYPNAPGVISLDVRRPFPDSPRYQLFFGTFDDDNVPEEDTYLPLIARSQWCAACHQFSFWGTPIYQSFKEWKESPFPAMGVECQSCHMLPDGVTTNVAPGMGGVERDPLSIHAHTMPGALSELLLQNTVSMTLQTQPLLNTLAVSVTLYNYGAGHQVPTDHPGRHMILTVTVTGGSGQPLVQVGGQQVPVWGGAQAGQPGTAYAKVLRDPISGEYPVVSYWKQTYIVSDSRIPALSSDTKVFQFFTPQSGGMLKVTAELRFRRNFQAEMDARGWDETDILMEQAQKLVVLSPRYDLFMPVVWN